MNNKNRGFCLPEDKIKLSEEESKLLVALAFSKAHDWWSVVPDVDKRNDALNNLEDADLIEINPILGMRITSAGMYKAGKIRNV